MRRRAIIIGGTGQIGRAAASALIGRDWDVVLLTRDAARAPSELRGRGAEVRVVDRSEPGALATAVGAGADLLVDMIGYDAQDARQLLEIQHGIGHIISISSASVYCDDGGRTLDEARQHGFPDLPVPITETQSTVDPGPDTYSTRKVAMERTLLDNARVRATILRPCAIHGPFSRYPREWWFVKRLLDGRTHVPVAYAGRSRFQTSATANIAALVAAVAETASTGVFNAVDPDAPDVAMIGAAVMAAIDRTAVLVPVQDPTYPPGIGTNPWAIPRPFVLSDDAARRIGYAPVAAYAEAVAAASRWLIQVDPLDWRSAFPQLADLFDYSAEDAWLEAMATNPPSGT